MSEFMFITLIALGVLIEGSSWLFQYRFKKQNEYANDERWQTILTKVDKVKSAYFNFMGIPILLGQFLFIVATNNPIYVALEIVFLISLIVFIGRKVAEFIALKYYNANM